MAKYLILLGLLLVAGAAVYYWREPILEKVKGWRTIIWNSFLAAAPSAAFLADQLQVIDFKQFLTPLNAVIAGIIIALIGFWLRAVTTGPVGSKN